MKIKIAITREYDITGEDHGHLFEGMTIDGAIEEALRLFSDDLDSMTTDSASVEVIK